jgi:hypothetical protein
LSYYLSTLFNNIHTYIYLTFFILIKVFNDIYTNCSNIKGWGGRESVENGEGDDNRMAKEKNGKGIHKKKVKEIMVLKGKRKEGRG